MHLYYSEHSVVEHQVLEEIGAADIPRITIWNKLDLVEQPDVVGGLHRRVILAAISRSGHIHMSLGPQVRKVAAGRESVVCLSAVTGEGVDELLESLVQQLTKHMVFIRALIPFSLVCRLWQSGCYLHGRYAFGCQLTGMHTT